MAGRTRSRNYPAFGLAEAIQKARELYDRDGKASVAREEAVKAWGYAGLNGASLRALAALNQYGLVDSPAPKTVRLSPRALTILLEPEDSPERVEAIREAAKEPAIFGELLEQYPDGLPSDGAMVSHLVRNESFTEAAAKSLIAAFRDTLELAKPASNHNIPPSDTKKEPTRGPQGRSKGGRMDASLQTFTYSLPGNAVATLTIEGGPPTREGVRLLGAFLDLVKSSLASTDATEGKDNDQPDAPN